jgi:hypothetical protein
VGSELRPDEHDIVVLHEALGVDVEALPRTENERFTDLAAPGALIEAAGAFVVGRVEVAVQAVTAVLSYGLG